MSTPNLFSSWQQRYLDRFYRSRPGWIDGTTEFHSLCQKYVLKDYPLLEIGAGPSNSTSRFLRSLSGLLTGLDIDHEVTQNEFLADAYVYDGKCFPFPDETFQAVVANYVNEHVKIPELLCSEIHRVLAQGGFFIFRTPNLFHYVALVGKLVPHGVTKLIANRLRNLPRDAHDPYPTFYHFNSRRRCTKLLRDSELELVELRLVEKEPSYGMWSRWSFLTFLAYERVVNSTNVLAPLRANIFCVSRKRVCRSS